MLRKHPQPYLTSKNFMAFVSYVICHTLIIKDKVLFLACVLHHLRQTPLPSQARFPRLRAHPQPSPGPVAAEPPPRPAPLLDALRRSLLDTLAALRMPALALLLAGALLAAAAPHHAALAVSGSRIGGSAFSSRSSRSFPPPSYRYTTSAPRMGGGGYSSVPFYSPSPFVSVGPAVGIGFS
ncbi:hypothetical protein ZWY2020_029711 [Hordeum vulgare]|nr:hypothetical protein ZWY2020_029711 [Hordeum vulgare]